MRSATKRLSRLLLDLFGLAISEGALDAAFRRGKPHFDADVAAILARLRRARVICSDETGVRIDGRTCWNWVFQNDEVVIHVSAAAAAPAWWPRCWTGTARRSGCPTSMARSRAMPRTGRSASRTNCATATYAIEAGDAVFAPRMKALLLRAVVLARRNRDLAQSTRREYRRRLECALDAVMALAPTHRDGRRLRKRYGKRPRSHLFTFLDHPEIAADNNGSERELRPTATYRKVTGGFRSDWGADLFAAVRSVIGTAERRGIDAYQAIRHTLRGQSASLPG